MRYKKRTYNEMMQRLVEDYRASGEPWPTTRKTIARWMIRKRKWDGGEDALVNVCARAISKALREEYYTDPQGRRVRTKHAAKFPLPGSEDGQQTLWDDIRSAPREFMERAFMGRRNQIVGDCIQLNTDVKSFNENKCKENPIPTLFDFTDDVLESEQKIEVATATKSKRKTSKAAKPVVLPDLPMPSFPPGDVPVPNAAMAIRR